MAVGNTGLIQNCEEDGSFFHKLYAVGFGLDTKSVAGTQLW